MPLTGSDRKRTRMETNEVTRTAPAKIYLCISDEEDHASEPFPTDIDYGDVTWCSTAPVAVTVEYIRADTVPAWKDAPGHIGPHVVDFGLVRMSNMERYGIVNVSAYELGRPRKECRYLAIPADTEAK